MYRVTLVSAVCLLVAPALRADNNVWWTAQPLTGSAGVITQGSPNSQLELSFDSQQTTSWLISAVYQVVSGGARSWSLDYWTYYPGSSPSDEYFPNNELNEFVNPGTLAGGAGYFVQHSSGSTFANVPAGTYMLHQFKWTVPVGYPEATIYGAIGEIGFVGDDTAGGYERVALAANTAREGKVTTDPNGDPVFEPVPIISLQFIPEPSTFLLLMPIVILVLRRSPRR